MRIVDIDTKNVESRPGVYRIYAPDFTCGRLLDQDSTGLLYIGKSNNLQRRLNYLRSACNLEKEISPNKRGEIHVFGKALFNLIESKIDFLESNPLLNPNNLTIEFSYTDNFSEVETKQLNEYLLLFGEVPPFNFKR